MAVEQGRSRPTSESRTPEFSNLEEDAEFWDTHDITDFLDELRPVKAQVAANLSGRRSPGVISIPLEQRIIDELRRVGKTGDP